MEHIEIRRDARREWRWRHIAENGQIIATSGEGYVRKQWAYKMAVKLHPGMPIVIRQPTLTPAKGIRP